MQLERERERERDNYPPTTISHHLSGEQPYLSYSHNYLPNLQAGAGSFLTERPEYNKIQSNAAIRQIPAYGRHAYLSLQRSLANITTPVLLTAFPTRTRLELLQLLRAIPSVELLGYAITAVCRSGSHTRA